MKIEKKRMTSFHRETEKRERERERERERDGEGEGWSEESSDT